MKKITKIMGEYFDMFFPAITEENIARRTIVLYALLYVSLFFTGLSLGSISVSNLAFAVVLYLFFGLTASSFIVANRFPNPAIIIKDIHGFKLFIFGYVAYVCLLILISVFVFAFYPNYSEFYGANILTILYIVGFVVCPLIVALYYLITGASSIYHFFQKRLNKKM